MIRSLLLVLAACRDPKPDPTGHGADPRDTAGEVDTGTPPTTLPVDPDQDGDTFPASVDCDDDDPNTFPGAPDLCGDDVRTNCDRTDDDGLVTIDGVATFTALDQALSAAMPGSEVRVCGGTWIGSFTAPVPVRMVGHRGRDFTRLDGDAAGVVLTVPGGTTLTGLTIQNGRGGGLVTSTLGTLDLVDCAVTGNRGQEGGGIVLVGGTVATLTGTEVTANSAVRGGGIHAAAGSSITLVETTVSGNDATLSGAGIELVDSALSGGTLIENTVTEATDAFTDEQGGGGLATTGVCTAEGVDIGWNVSFGGGGGVSVRGGSLSLVDVAVHDNLTDFLPYNQLHRDGGGVLVFDGTLTMSGSTEIYANHAYDDGGGIYVRRGTIQGGVVRGNDGHVGGGVWARDSEVRDMVMEANTAFEGAGAAFVTVTASSIGVFGNLSSSIGGGVSASVTDITASEIVGNTALAGGGWYSYLGGGTLTSTVVSDNVATLAGGGLYVFSSTVALTDSLVTGNEAPEGGGAFALLVGFAGYPYAIESVGSDWGEGPTDNVGGDVHLDDVGLDYAYGAGVDFLCDSTVASCQ